MANQKSKFIDFAGKTFTAAHVVWIGSEYIPATAATPAFSKVLLNDSNGVTHEERVTDTGIDEVDKKDGGAKVAARVKKLRGEL